LAFKAFGLAMELSPVTVVGNSILLVSFNPKFAAWEKGTRRRSRK